MGERRTNRVAFWRDSDRAAGRAPGRETPRTTVREPAVPGREPVPLAAQPTQGAVGSKRTERARAQIGSHGDQACEIVAFAGTAGTTRWRAECGCEWLASVSRTSRYRAIADARTHLRSP